MPSFDIVSEVDSHELTNAIDIANRELKNRFDFKNTSTSIAWRGEMGIEITSSTEERCSAALDVLKDKLVKRKVSLKTLDAEEPRQSGKETKILCTLKAGISKEQASKLNKLIRDEGPKGVKSQVMGEELRVSSKSRDHLQVVQQLHSGGQRERRAPVGVLGIDIGIEFDEAQDNRWSPYLR